MSLVLSGLLCVLFNLSLLRRSHKIRLLGSLESNYGIELGQLLLSLTVFPVALARHGGHLVDSRGRSYNWVAVD
jgi:hypothetical protein